MGKQVVFYANEQDQNELYKLLDAEGFRALPSIIRTDSEIVSCIIQDFKLPKGQDFFYLIQSDINDIEAIYEEYSNNPFESGLNFSNSPVIEMTPSKCVGNKINEGRLYLGLDTNDIFYTVVLKKFNKIANIIKKWEKTNQFGFYVGPNTANLSKNGTIKIKHHQIDLNVGE